MFHKYVSPSVFTYISNICPIVFPYFFTCFSPFFSHRFPTKLVHIFHACSPYSSHIFVHLFPIKLHVAIYFPSYLCSTLLPIFFRFPHFSIDLTPRFVHPYISHINVYIYISLSLCTVSLPIYFTPRFVHEHLQRFLRPLSDAVTGRRGAVAGVLRDADA